MLDINTKVSQRRHVCDKWLNEEHCMHNLRFTEKINTEMEVVYS